MKDRVLVVIIGIFSGFLGAKFFALTDKFDREVLKLLLQWQFLGFFLILLILLMFNKHINNLLKQGKLKLKYGDTEISFEQLSEKIEQDIENKLEQVSPDSTVTANEMSNSLEKIKNLFNIDSETLTLIMFHIGTSKFRWRNLTTLIKKTGLDEQQIEKIIKAYPDLINRSLGKTENIIYRLTDKMELLFIEKFNNK